MSKRRKNAGAGYGYMFHGAFKEKKDAVAKERKTKGAWIKGVYTPQGHRYVVMSPRENPRKKRAPRENYEGGYFSERHGTGSLGIVVWANTPAGPFHVQPYVNNWETATHELGKYKKLERARLEARKYLEREGRARGHNPTELLVMGANPHERELTVPPGSTITIRMNPTQHGLVDNPPEHYTAAQARAAGHARDLGFSNLQKRVRRMLKRASGSEGARVARSYKRYRTGERPSRSASKVFHELYGAQENPAVCGIMIGGYPCSRKPGHKGPHLPQGATMRPRSRLRSAWKPRRTNPSAAALHESFTGRETDAVRTLDEPCMPAGDYAQLGELLALYVKPMRGSQVQVIRPNAQARPIVLAAENARQIYFAGGDQTLGPEILELFGAVDRGANVYELGEARRIDYKQRKEHVPDPELDEWKHYFGEENSLRPLVLWDQTHARILLEGGDYRIRREGIVN